MVHWLSFYVGNSDYVSVMASLQQLTPEDSSTVISIGIINDNITEGEEDFTIELSSASPEVGISPSTAVITILDDDGQGSVRRAYIYNPGNMAC